MKAIEERGDNFHLPLLVEPSSPPNADGVRKAGAVGVMRERAPQTLILPYLRFCSLSSKWGNKSRNILSFYEGIWPGNIDPKGRAGGSELKKAQSSLVSRNNYMT